jgi:hypothetical protein
MQRLGERSFHKQRVGTCYSELMFLYLVGAAGPVVHSSGTGARNIDALFSCSGGPGTVSIESVSGHVTPNLCFCISWDLWVTKCIPVGLGHKMSTHYISCWSGPGAVSKKARPIHYAELVLLHPVGSAGHVGHSGASRARNMIALFFMLGWDQYGFDKKCARTRYADLAFLHLVGSAAHIVHSGASGVQNVDPPFFLLEWVWCCFHKKCAEIHDTELVILHPVLRAGHVVHSSMSGARNVIALFFMLGWDQYRFNK